MEKTVYIILTNTGTLFSKAIGVYTRKDLNHASIAFDEKLNEMYSFGRKNKNNPFVAGFIRENVSEGLFKQAKCAIFSCKVTTEEFTRMRNKIQNIERNKELYKYNLIGLFGVAMNKEIQRERAFFCSQFVATILNEIESPKLQVAPCLVQPHHIAQLSSLKLMYEGKLQTYVGNSRGVEERYLIHTNMWKRLAIKMNA